MRPIVRDLYKRFLIVGRHYPEGLGYIRDKVKKAFFDNADILYRKESTATPRGLDANELEFKKAISKGRFWVREIEAISKMHKYRAMKNRYDKK
mmetsp:Transcript_7516/g.10375  ORF Transcript_7516/g.10375 Transcript_7516/m.10375 type:complete len:94 (-) Transcript_7516:188-469(-)